MKKAAIVILNYNGKDFLQQFLPSLVKFSQPHQVYVADNASTDDSVDLLKEHFKEVQLITLTENYGYAGGYNQALNQIEEELLILINSDVEVTENWVQPLIDEISSSEEVVACQPKIRSYDQKDHFEYAGAAGGYLDWLGYPFCRGRIFETLEVDKGQYDKREEVFWASGACFAIKKETFHKMGAFDAQFFAHMEEIDLCWRIQNANQKIVYQPQSVVYHVGGGTLSSSSPKKTYLNFRNGLLLMVKNLPFFRLLYTLPIRSVLDGVAMLKFLKEGESRHAYAIIKAHFHAFPIALKYFFKQERPVAPKSAHQLFKRSIVFQYYLYGKKKFSDLTFDDKGN